MFEALGNFAKADAIYLTIILIAVLAGSLSMRREGFGRLAKMALAWVAIFGVILIAVAYRDDAQAVFARVAGEADPARGRVEGGEFRLRARSDGHFWVRAEVNGEPVLFLIDTGASGVVLTTDAARRVGIDPDNLTYDQIARTANGAVRGASARVSTIEVGPIVRSDMPVSVTEGELDTNLLGMRFLQTLSGWRVEGDTLIMRP
jgi:aspartyl protease family protein